MEDQLEPAIRGTSTLTEALHFGDKIYVDTVTLVVVGCLNKIYEDGSTVQVKMGVSDLRAEASAKQSFCQCVIFTALQIETSTISTDSPQTAQGEARSE